MERECHISPPGVKSSDVKDFNVTQLNSPTTVLCFTPLHLTEAPLYSLQIIES